MESDRHISNGRIQGVRTSVDIARDLPYNRTSLAGSKRNHGQISPIRYRTANESVIADRTAPAPRNDSHRPSLEPQQSRHLKASEIKTTSTAGSQALLPSEYSQRKSLASTPGPLQNSLLSLSHPSYGLPQSLLGNFASLGINSLYPWQSSCLLGRGLLTGEKNLVYTAPTGGGKSLVADVLMLKRIIEEPPKKAILILPYVALVQEKLTWLRKATEGVIKLIDNTNGSQAHASRWRKVGDKGSIRVVGFFGGSKARVTWADVDIAVCTIEKANSLVNSAIEECTIDQLGVVVLDELHMLDDANRGYLMEIMTTKLLSLEQRVQIVGMSATLSNTELLAQWLDAKFYQSKYRPIPLEEYLVYDNSIYPAATSSTFLRTASQLNASSIASGLEQCRAILPSKNSKLKSPVINAVVALASETVKAGYGVLVFCSSRAGCETDAVLISEVMSGYEEISPELVSRRKDVICDLQSTSVGLDNGLERTILRGVAFHHAGLTIEEREIVARAYDKGIIKVIVATCSLAAGINIPARRVILHGARMGRDLVGPAMLRQMRGRAGRKGKDEVGESYVCCQKSDLEAVAELLEAEIPPVESCLTPGKRGIKRALLEVIATRLATSADGVNDYVKRTLLYSSVDHNTLQQLVESTIKDLLGTSLITLDFSGMYEATLLGQAIVASSFTPEDGIFIYEEIRRALRAFVMDGEMHIFYMFTPVNSSGLGEINWQNFRKEMENLDESGLRVLSYVGINPSLVNKMANSSATLKETTLEEITTARIYRRFYAALQLRDLSNEVSIHAIARKYAIARGTVQTLAQTCHGFAAGMIKFCQHMGWGMLAAVLEHMSDRLQAEAKADLLDLAQITFVKSSTARVFWENGFKSVRQVAEAEAKDLVPILLLAQPRKLRLEGDDVEMLKRKVMAKAEVIVLSAARLWERQTLVEIED
ncbi:MAG: hypothetical protein M1827_004356 [Pycnora praestabilis]|nr:MAG: hypothetical protein M1827_004356 [Pycnora praestabilis]